MYRELRKVQLKCLKRVVGRKIVLNCLCLVEYFLQILIYKYLYLYMDFMVHKCYEKKYIYIYCLCALKAL